MKIGVPTWRGVVSPVLDTAERMVIVEEGAGGEATRREVALRAAALPRRVTEIARLELDVLICGAVSRPLAEMLVAGGVTLVPWIAGDVEEVLAAFADGRLEERRFLMPGCGGGRGFRGPRRRGRGGAWSRWRK